jgi:hypothetical protein
MSSGSAQTRWPGRRRRASSHARRLLKCTPAAVPAGKRLHRFTACAHPLANSIAPKHFVASPSGRVRTDISLAAATAELSRGLCLGAVRHRVPRLDAAAVAGLVRGPTWLCTGFVRGGSSGMWLGQFDVVVEVEPDHVSWPGGWRLGRTVRFWDRASRNRARARPGAAGARGLARFWLVARRSLCRRSP